MRLKRLVLQGYKTFASKTEFEFDSGITSIIGPNGSGKSNIADAVRWVLGEQSYSTLRGKRTADMIFTGSRSRPRAGMAQVILTLDNTDGWLPIDYTEVEVGRRAFRSGENEYILNGQRVRLKDITELLATSGLAQRTYTIIGQGLVDQALSLRAEERRALFEEAAGINHYKAKRALTLRRLEETQRNLLRVHDILAEISPRMRSLRRQAARARNYEQVAADLRSQLLLWYGYKWERAKDAIREARETAANVEEGWQHDRNRLQTQQRKIDSQRQDINGLSQKVNQVRASRENIQRQIEKVRRQLAVLEERQRSIKNQLSEIEQESPVLARQQTAAHEVLAQAITELQTAQTELRQSQMQVAQFDDSPNIKSAQAAVESVRQRRKSAQKSRNTLSRELKQLRRDHNEQERRVNKLRNDLARIEARTELLDQIRPKGIKISPDVKMVGWFTDLVEIPRQYAAAIDVALRSRLTTIVLDNSRNLWQLLDSAKQRDTLSAITLSRLKLQVIPSPPKNPAVIDWACNVIRFDESIRPLAQLLLGPVLLVEEDKKAAYRIAELLPAGTLAVTPSGFVAHAGGLVEQSGRDEQNRILARESEWQQANNALERTRVQLAEAELIITKHQTAIHEKQERQEQLQDEEGNLDQLQREADRQLAEAQQQRQIIRQGVASAKTIVAGRQAVVDSRRATLNQLDRQVNGLKNRQEALRHQRQSFSLETEELALQKLKRQLKQLDAQLEPLQTSRRAARESLARLEDELVSLRNETHHRESRYTQVKIALSQQEAQIEGLQERIKADLGIVSLSYDDDQTGPTPLPMSDVVEQLPRVTDIPADIEDTIQQQRGQMQRMGAINPEAPGEYEETKTRFEFLTQQVEDLNQTENQLRQVIEELDELTSRAFVETVEKVNTVFGHTFTELFGGGAARLTLTDPSDLINSGVDIIARLPNRREQGLGLLSGGERSLTAVALIFSLLKVSPTPFCVLDEVDAALDEANINRFRDLLRDLSVNTQFIIITHNRGTVQAANTLYGISMAADSTSQAISIKPEEYVKQVALV